MNLSGMKRTRRCRRAPGELRSITWLALTLVAVLGTFSSAVAAETVKATDQAVLERFQEFSSNYALSQKPSLEKSRPLLKLPLAYALSVRSKGGPMIIAGYGSGDFVDIPIRDGQHIISNRKGEYGPDQGYRLRDGQVRISLDNIDEFRGIDIPKKVKDFFRDDQFGNGSIVDLVIEPTGYMNDAYLGKFLSAHILRVEATLVKRGRPFKWNIESKRKPEPYAPFADQRTARELAVLGVSAGQDVEKVKDKVEKELGHKLAFDKKRMVLSSPERNCKFTYWANKTAPGQKCFKAEFRVAKKGVFSTKHGLVRASYQQALHKDAEGSIGQMLIERYGEPVMVGNHTRRISANVTNTMPLNSQLLSWGKRMTRDRKGMVNTYVKMPVHALEAEIGVSGDMKVINLTLTDKVLADEINQANEKAIEAKKAKEDMKRAVRAKF